MFGKKSLVDAREDAGTAAKMLEEASNQIKTLFNSKDYTSLRSDILKKEISRIQTFIDLAKAKLTSAKSKIL